MLDMDAAGSVPLAPFRGLSTLWLQITGTRCNLECTHCLNASGPRDPWLAPLDGDAARRAIREAEGLGVKEIYFTGGEPFLHPEILPLIGVALATAPTTVLTNGTLIVDAVADRLAAMAAAAPYSLEIRVSLDDVDEAVNDAVRGRGAWDRAVRAIERLDARGLLPIVTVTDLGGAEGPGHGGLYHRFRAFLLGLGVEKPRLKILPVFPVGRMEDRSGARLTEEHLAGFDRSVFQCSDARVVARGGVFACPILAGLPGARLSTGGLADSFRPAPLYHPACVTCHESGASCRN